MDRNPGVNDNGIASNAMKNALSNDRALFVMLQDDLLLFLLREPFGLVAASGLKQGIEEGDHVFFILIGGGNAHHHTAVIQHEAIHETKEHIGGNAVDILAD